MQRGGRPHTKKVESLLSPGEKVESRYGPAEASIITMVEAQAAESSRKGGLVCRTHASIRAVLAGRMGPGERERHGAAPDGFHLVSSRAEPEQLGNRRATRYRRAAREWVSSPPISWRGPSAAAREASADASLGPEKALKTSGL